jgi:hypothetical protein
MGDPRRLLNELGDGEELERELLASIQRVDPPGHAKAEAWARLSAQIGAVALVSTVHSSAAASAASSHAATSGVAVEGAKAAAGTGLKSALAPAVLKVVSAKLVVGLAIAGSVVGASAIWVHERAQRAAPAPSTQAATVVAPEADTNSALSAEPSSDESADNTSASERPPASTDTSARPSSEQRRRDQLSAESSLLTQARAELRRGDVRGAQQLLRRLRVEFPNGVLGQEREVLAIEVLAASGNAAAAKRRAEKFIAAHPESPHSAQLSRFTDTP